MYGLNLFWNGNVACGNAAGIFPAIARGGVMVILASFRSGI
jgi:hypothetical protein